VRYYLWTEEGVWRLPSRLHAELASGRAALRKFANSRQRIVEAYIRQFGRQPLLVKARGVYYSFDAQGHLDVGSAAEVMANALDRAEDGRAGPNVVDLGPRLRDRQWKREHSWKPGREVLRRITDDVTGVTRIARFRQ
jgi:hypothetical protein